MSARDTPRPLPAGPLVAFYGDDFTGSSAAMEVLAFGGVPTVLFLDAPSPQRLANFSEMRAIGVAGTARAQSPTWMDTHLPGTFGLLASLGAPVAHYKVCSTFDSSPQIGSIGRAVDLSFKSFESAWIPMVVADPGMGRYQSFGHLFAFADGVGYRLDRHPTMARHPSTPMDEADLGRHLAKQTHLPVGLVDFVAMKRGGGEAQLDRRLADGARIISLDVLDQETLIEAGRLIWERGGTPTFCVGSQGIGAALVAYWRSVELIPAKQGTTNPGPVQRTACVSGSVSPVTASQIAHALDNGFEGIRLDARRVVDIREWNRVVSNAGEEALAALGRGYDPLIYTAAGPDDPAVPAFLETTRTAGLSAEIVNERLGAGLGQVLHTVIVEAGLTRAVISGGDTSGRAAARLGIDALTAICPLDPGGPLCRAYGENNPLDGLEIVLKGGQVGRPDFLMAVKQGGRN